MQRYGGSGTFAPSILQTIFNAYRNLFPVPTPTGVTPSTWNLVADDHQLGSLLMKNMLTPRIPHPASHSQSSVIGLDMRP